MRSSDVPHLLVVGLLVVGLAGCATAAGSPVPASSSAGGPATQAPPPTAGASPAATPAPTAPAIPESWLLVGRAGEPDLHLVEATRGISEFDLPIGTPRPDWGRVVTATIVGASTIVRDLTVQPGFGGAEITLKGHWQLPRIGLDPLPVGRSVDGSTVALVEGPYDPGATTSRFAIVEHVIAGAVQTAGDAPFRLARIVELAGSFEYDTLSPDGRILYVVEHLDAKAGGRYQVRAVDVDTGVMRATVIVDKVNPEERMAGEAIAQVRRPDGLVLTLYRGPEHPFIHALNSKDAWAICIDLPAGGAGDGGADADEVARDWDLVASANGRSVFAINATVGTAVEVNVGDLSIRQTASLATTAAAGTGSPFVLAKFGHSEVGPAGRRLVASPDGTMLFAGGRDGITVIRTRDLTVARHDAAGTAIDAIATSVDGKTVFALVRGQGRIVALDAATGRLLGTVPGDGYDRLLATSPW